MTSVLLITTVLSIIYFGILLRIDSTKFKQTVKNYYTVGTIIYLLMEILIVWMLFLEPANEVETILQICLQLVLPIGLLWGLLTIRVNHIFFKIKKQLRNRPQLFSELKLRKDGLLIPNENLDSALRQVSILAIKVNSNLLIDIQGVILPVELGSTYQDLIDLYHL